MKKTLVIISLIVCANAAAQTTEISVVAKVEKDRVLLKWFPANFGQMRSLVNKGAIIDRVELGSMQDANSVDFSGAQQTTIGPAGARLNALAAGTTERDKAETLLEPLLSAEIPAEEEGRNFSFALVTLENAVSGPFGELIGAQWTDTAATAGKIYAYRIRVDGMPEARIVVNTGQPTRYPAIDNFSVLLDQKKAVELRWKAGKYKAFGYGFQLEKAIDAPENPKNLTETPYVPVRTADEKRDKDDFFRDLDLQEGHTHYYRLVGLNYFGEPAMFSEWQKIYVPNHVHAEVYIDSIFADGQRRVVVGGATSGETRPKNIAQYALLRSEQKDADYRLMEVRKSTDSTFRFEVAEPKTGDRYYYKVVAISPDNDSAFSLPHYFFTLDQEPPAAPSGLTATIDSLGIVRLSWQAPADNDLQGYRIFRANDPREEFTERNTELSLSTTFTDTVLLNNLTPEVYYCVKSADANYNNSGFSDTLIVFKPDTIAPVPPSLNPPHVRETAIVVSWIASPSPDIARNYLLRLTNGTIDTLLSWDANGWFYGHPDAAEWNRIENPTDGTPFTDTDIVPGNAYAYFVRSVDKAGNSAESDRRTIYYEPGYRNALTGVEATADRGEKAIRISWPAPADPVFSYQIYRAVGDGEFRLYKTIEDPGANTFTDKQVGIGNTYRYYVKYVLPTGVHGLPSKEIRVNY